jgi:hypothetical protein
MAKYELPDIDGSVAYNVYDTRFGNAVPKPKPAALPDERPDPKKQPLKKAKLAVSPFAAIGMVLVVLLLAMVVYGYVQYYEASSRVGELESELVTVQRSTQKLRSAYESRIDLSEVEQRARQLGMSQPTSKQSVYLNVKGADHTEVFSVDDRGFLEKAADAISDSFRGMLEYFR